MILFSQRGTEAFEYESVEEDRAGVGNDLASAGSDVGPFLFVVEEKSLTLPCSLFVTCEPYQRIGDIDI
jgi:hypothetical protein